MNKKMYSEEKAIGILRELGVPSYYRGFQITLMALSCIAENGDCLLALQKEIYLPISERISCSHATVETTIRRTSERAWKNNPERLCQLTRQNLGNRPQVRQFLEAVFIACCENSEDGVDMHGTQEVFSLNHSGCTEEYCATSA